MNNEVALWLDCLTYQEPAARFFQQFMDDVVAKDSVLKGMSPTDLLDFQTKANTREAKYYIGERVRHWINGMKLTASTKRTYYSRIASFFLHRKAPLPPDPSFTWKNSVTPVDGYLPMEELRLIVASSSKMYRAVLLMKIQGLLDNQAVIYISDHHAEAVVKAVTQNVGVFRLALPSRKTNLNPYFTMLSTQSDWGDAFRGYMKSTIHNLSSHLFWNKNGNPLCDHNLQAYFHRRAVQTGVVKELTPECPTCHGGTIRRWRMHHGHGMRKVCYVCRQCGSVQFPCDMGEAWRRQLSRVRYGKHPHETRDLMSSRWAMSPADRVVREGIMGHRLDPNQYEKFKYQAGYAEREYSKALPWLNILSNDPEKVDRSEIDVSLSRERAKVEALTTRLNEMQPIVDAFGTLREILQDEKKLKRFERLLSEE